MIYHKEKPEVEFSIEELNGIGPGGNAFALIGKVTNALAKAKFHRDEIKKFREEATSGDFKHLIATIEKWVEVI